jgi:hypothetical protein
MNLIGYYNSEDIWIPDPVQKSNVEQKNEYNVNELKLNFERKYAQKCASY